MMYRESKAISHGTAATTRPLQDVQMLLSRLTADGNCQGMVTADDVNNGSQDPDDDPLALSLSPPAP
jgi:hypothetical protein